MAHRGGAGRDLDDLVVVVSWPWRRPARRLFGPVPVGHGATTGEPGAVAALVALAGRGAHLYVVSQAGPDQLFAELRAAGLVPHLRGVAARRRDLQAYLLDHRCLRDRAVFVGGDDREERMAVRAGFEVGVALFDSAAV